MHTIKWPLVTLAATLLTGCNLIAQAGTAPASAPVNKPYAVAQYHEIGTEQTQKEAGSQMQCNPGGARINNGVMIWRTHSGDENGNSTVGCANFIQGGHPLQYADAQAESVTFPQHRYPTGGYECSANRVIVGRDHEGDEKGDTTYYCRGLKGYWGEAIITQNRHWSPWIKEKEFTFKCPENEVLTGFDHRGGKDDENAVSSVQCAKLF